MNLKYKIFKKYTALRFYLSSSENIFYLFYYRHIFRPAKNTLDEFIDDYSRNNGPVTFLQVGANDGLVSDPLHKFIKRDNWRGIMLEPQPEVYRQYLVKTHQRRPEITAINAALDTQDGMSTLYVLNVSAERWATGLSSFNKSVLIDTIKNGAIRKKARKRGIRLPDNEEDMIEARQIKTISPDTLLRHFDPEGFKLLAVDTEGYDFEILKMLDINRVAPEVIIYEENNFDPETANDCRKYLTDLGYTCRAIGRDVVAIKPTAKTHVLRNQKR